MTMTTNKPRSKRFPAALGLLLVCGGIGFAVADDQRWLHIRVEDWDDDHVYIDVPVELVEALLPTIATRELSEARIDWSGQGEFDGVDLRQLLVSLRDAPESEFVTVRTRHESVRVAKENGLLLIDVDEDDERVRVRMPIALIDALLDPGEQRLDLVAALRTLAESEIGDLLTVESDDTSVRIWIDSRETGE